MPDDKNEPVHIIIDGTLDLHHFSPKELKYLIPDYLVECKKLQINEIRIVHGKGKGVLRRTVHSILGRLDSVQSFYLAEPERGGWGATIVNLR